MKVFTVYDSKAELYLPPFYAPATGAGLRSFEQAASSEGHQFNSHGADYTLFEIGEFNEVNGHIEMYNAQKNLGTALQNKPAELLPIQGGE